MKHLWFAAVTTLGAGCGGVPADSWVPRESPGIAAPATGSSVRTAWPAELDLETVVSIALQSHPQIHAANLELPKARARLVTAETNPHNPDLGLDFSRAAPFGGVDDYSIRLELSQTFQLAGQRARRIAVAEAEIDRARAASADARRQLRIEATSRFFEVLYLLERGKISSEGIAIARRLVEAAEARWKAKLVPELEVGLVRMEHLRIQIELDLILQAIQSAKTRLAALMGDPGRTDFEIKGDLGPGSPLPEVGPLVELAFRSRQDLQAARAQVRIHSEQARLVEAEAQPNLTAGIFLEREGAFIDTRSGTLSDRDNIVGLSFSIPLPFRNLRRGEALEAMVDQRRAEFEVQALVLGIRRDVEVSVARLRSLRRVEGSYDQDLVPLASKNLAGQERAFAAGETGTLQVLKAREDLLRVRAARLDLRFEARAALAELEAAVGVGAEQLK